MPFGGNDWLALTPEETLEPDLPICDGTLGGLHFAHPMHARLGQVGLLPGDARAHTAIVKVPEQRVPSRRGNSSSRHT